MEIELNKAYVSGWDNIEFPIFKLSDGYVCITYSQNHCVYNINFYTEQEFVEQGFERAEYEDSLFEDLTINDIR